jgi:hypothetical protein
MHEACGLKVSVVKTKLERQLGRPWRRWVISQLILEKQDRRGWNGFI